MYKTGEDKEWGLTDCISFVVMGDHGLLDAITGDRHFARAGFRALKTTPHTDTYHGRFVELVPDQRVVEVVEFESADPALRGEMTITFTLSDADGGTDLVAVHENLPSGLSPEDNETGWRSSLAKLAALVEGAPPR